MPIVHGLERRYGKRVDFLYLHVGEARTKPAQTRLGFQSTPQIVLLRGDGSILRWWVGVPDERELEAGLAELLRR